MSGCCRRRSGHENRRVNRPEEKVEHIARLGVAPEAVEEVCFVKSSGLERNPEERIRYLMSWAKPKRVVIYSASLSDFPRQRIPSLRAGDDQIKRNVDIENRTADE